MAFVDDPNSQDSQQIAGESPLSSGNDTSPMADNQAPANVGSTGSTIQSQTSEDMSGPQTGTVNKKAPKASSGMFTNIQKYVEKNKPQAQKIAGAVTQDVGKQAEQIRQAAAEKQAQQQQTIQANQNLINQNQDWANQQVQNIMNPGLQAQAPETSQLRTGGIVQATQLPQVQAPSVEDASRFQQLMSGNIQGLQSVQDLNLAQQQNRASALAQLAGDAGTEEGRRNLLGQTFRKQGDYTRGMSGLDQLITSGDQAAREALVAGTAEQAQGLQSQLGDISAQARQDLAGQQEAIRNLSGDITSLATDPLTGIQTDIQSQIEAEQAAREGLIPEYQTLEKQYSDRMQQLRDIYGDTSYWGSKLDKALVQSLRGSGHWYGTDELNKLSGASLSDQDLRLLGIDKNWYDQNIERMQKYNDADTPYLSFAGNLRSQILKSADPAAVQKALEQEGLTLSQLQSGKDLSMANLASEEQINRYNALKSLLGQQDIIAPEAKKDYVSSEELQAILDKYK